jgi:hypothetical protein
MRRLLGRLQRGANSVENFVQLLVAVDITCATLLRVNEIFTNLFKNNMSIFFIVFFFFFVYSDFEPTRDGWRRLLRDGDVICAKLLCDGVGDRRRSPTVTSPTTIHDFHLHLLAHFLLLFTHSNLR